MSGHYQRPGDVAIVFGTTEEGDESSSVVCRSHLPSGSLRILRGTGAIIWIEAVSDERADTDLATQVSGPVGLSVEAIRHDVTTFADEPVSQGLLERTDEPD